MKGFKSVSIAVIGSLAISGLAHAAAVEEAAVLSSAGTSTSSAAPVDPEAAAQQTWRENMAKVPTSGKGCFHATYPNYVWDNVACTGSVLARPGNSPQDVRSAQLTVGNGADYAAQGHGLITRALGTFPTFNSQSEESTGGYATPSENGFNNYTLQLNTNINSSTAACHGGIPLCHVWQQFIYSSNFEGLGYPAVFMQYWVLSYTLPGGVQGIPTCPSNPPGTPADQQWVPDGNGSCFHDSAVQQAPYIQPEDLGHAVLLATATPGGLDEVGFFYGSEGAFVGGQDSVLDISSAWTATEFNVLGNFADSQANFSPGTSVSVSLSLTDSSTMAPTCLGGQGTTGETNNLIIEPCQASFNGGPEIQFSEYARVVPPPVIVRPINPIATAK